MATFATTVLQNPARAANWIWLRAGGIAAGTEPPTSDARDGKRGSYWIRRATAFAARLETCEQSSDLAEFGMDEPDLFTAFCIYQQSGASKALLEALILAKETPGALSREFGVTVSAVRAYEAVFFDVRSRLGNRAIILQLLLGPMGYAGLAGADASMICRLYGYFMGSIMARAFSEQFDPAVQCGDVAGINAALRADTLFTIAIRAAAAAKTAVVTPMNQKFWVSQLLKAVEIEKLSGTSDLNGTGTAAGVNSLLAQFEYHIGGFDTKTKQPVALTATAAMLADSAAELSASMTTAITVGQHIDGLDEMKRLTFPSPTAATS